ncbi:MAG: hypothetical protein H6653_09045 [Ardenticatenaceae bacterium]|nr:hypothetical protein [Ardenticatenaceae bacterium]
MTLAEAPFWVWGLLVLNSSLFLFMALTPLLWKWHQEVQAKAKLRLVPLVIETKQV